MNQSAKNWQALVNAGELAAALGREDLVMLDARVLLTDRADNLRDDHFKRADILAAEFSALLAGQAPDEVAVMCGSGVTACHHLLAMAHAGLHGAKLFTGSWSGWLEDPSRPVATGPAADADAGLDAGSGSGPGSRVGAT